jgi:integrase
MRPRIARGREGEVMPRPLKGSVIEHTGCNGSTYRSLRFQAGGRRHRVPLGAVSAAQAERELAHVIADVERGTWRPQAIEAPPLAVPTFHEFAEEWWTRHEGQITAGTQLDYRWRLQVHLSYFNEMPLDTITFDTVERYIAAKLAEDDPLSPRSINMTVILLAAILESALERELIARNPAKGKGRRVRERAPARSYLDAAGQIVALLDAAGELDRDAPEGRRHVERRAMLATLTFAGLRISELLALRWRDVDLAGGWLTVGESKTDAGRRRVKIRGALRDELLAVRGRHQDAPQSAYMFATSQGGRMSSENFRNRVLGKPATIVDGEEKLGPGAVARANKRLEGEGLPPLPDKLTPHSLRRTFCSLLYALGETPPVVMQEMGHTDPGLALKVYAQSMRRGEDETARLRALVESGVVANGGQREEDRAVEQAAAEAA